MFEKVGAKAGQVVTSVSRRELLGRFGRGALAVAVAVGGILALPSIAMGDRPVPGYCDPLLSIPECAGAIEGTACGGLDSGGYCSGAPACGCYLGKRKRWRRDG
jgi:hypothetical protein